MSILVITTGGTIGAVAHDNLKKPDRIQKMPPDDVDLVQDALKIQFNGFQTAFLRFEHRDLNLIDQQYREKLVSEISDAEESKILITHGTDTLLQTAAFIFDHQTKIGNKAVLLTGSMVPLACGEESDGYMNLKFSLEQLSSNQLKIGVYVVLSDFVVPEKREGWLPRLYPFVPGRYEKYYDPEDGRFCRIRERAW